MSATYKLTGVQDKGQGRQLITVEAVLTSKGSDKPAVVAELLAMVIG